jgi:hypothetical protein
MQIPPAEDGIFFIILLPLRWETLNQPHTPHSFSFFIIIDFHFLATNLGLEGGEMNVCVCVHACLNDAEMKAEERCGECEELKTTKWQW